MKVFWRGMVGGGEVEEVVERGSEVRAKFWGEMRQGPREKCGALGSGAKGPGGVACVVTRCSGFLLQATRNENPRVSGV